MARHKEILAVRRPIAEKARSLGRRATAQGRKSDWNEYQRLKKRADDLLEEAEAVIAKARTLPKYAADDPVRMYFHLCRAIRAAFGSDVEARLILDAKELLSAQKESEWEEDARASS